MASGDTIYSLLKKHNFSGQQINKIIATNIFPKSYTLSPGQEYRVRHQGKRLELEFYSHHDDSAYVLTKNGVQSASAVKKDKKFSVKFKQVSGTVRGAILSSIKKLIPEGKVGYQFLDAFVLKYKLRKQVERGAPFSITVEKKYSEDGHLVKYGRILRASLKINDEWVHRRWIYFPKGGTFIGTQPQSERPFYSPVSFFQISSLFSRRRYHPIRKNYQPHLGIDFPAPIGHPVFAIQDGTVVKFGRNRASGRYVILKHAKGYESVYIHLSKIADKLKRGQKIKGGQTIGKIGCSGFCSKAHLHFAIKKNHRFINPLPLIKSYPKSQQHIVEQKIALFRKLVSEKKSKPL